MPEVSADRRDQRELWSRRLRWASYLVLACVLAYFFKKSFSSILEKTDGYDFYLASRALFEGEDPHQVMLREVGYLTYPPSAVIAFLPLAALGLIGYACAWSAINLVCILATPYLALGVVTGRGHGHPWWWYLVPMIVCFRCIETNNGLAQNNLFIGFGCLVCMHLIRRGWPGLAGLSIATMAAIKVTPALFGVYFLWKRAWTAAVATALGGVLWFLLLPGLFYGPTNAVEQYELWHEQTGDVLDPNVDFDYHPGQSIKATLLHLLTRSNARKPSKGEYYVNFLELNRDQVKAAAPVISGLILLALLLVSHRRTSSRKALDQYLEMALVLVAMLLMSPYVRKAHYASLYPAFAIACAALLNGAIPASPARWLRLSIVIFAVLVNGTSRDLVGRTVSDLASALSVMLWPTILFGATLGWGAWCCRDAVAKGNEEGQEKQDEQGEHEETAAPGRPPVQAP